jgi:hypothetical protein
MRFFKSNQPMSEEDEAAAVRLAAVATRTKAARTTRPTWGDGFKPEQEDYEPLPLKDMLQ